ncbi:MAG: tetratricopeptide repeat protein [Pseudomonadota bacterium]
MANFIQRLWRRRVFQIGALYLGAAWIILQVAVVVEQTLELPDWIDQLVLVLLGLAFPLALLLAWAQAIKETPDRPGVTDAKHESDVVAQPVIKKPDDKLSIAVLPFANLSEDKANEYFADGMTEDLLTALSLNRHMSVASRTSSFQFKGKSGDMRQIGQSLGVDYVVEGSVRPMGERVRITAQLIEAETGAHLWAEKYDQPLDALFDVQDDVLRSIIGSLNVHLSVGIAQDHVLNRPSSPTHWQKVQEAMVRLFTGSPENHDMAIQILEGVLEVEPDYAYANSVLAFAYLNRMVNGNSKTPFADYKSALPLIEKGLSLSPNDPTNLFYVASAAGYSGQFERAIELARHGLDINPNMIDFYASIAQACTNLGRYEEAERALDHLVVIRSPLYKAGAIWYRSILRSTELRYAEALPLIRKTIEAFPKYATPRLHMAIAQASLGNREQALETVAKVRKMTPDFNVKAFERSLKSYVYPIEGEADRRIALLQDLWDIAGEAA